MPGGATLPAPSRPVFLSSSITDQACKHRRRRSSRRLFPRLGPLCAIPFFLASVPPAYERQEANELANPHRALGRLAGAVAIRVESSGVLPIIQPQLFYKAIKPEQKMPQSNPHSGYSEMGSRQGAISAGSLTRKLSRGRHDDAGQPPVPAPRCPTSAQGEDGGIISFRASITS